MKRHIIPYNATLKPFAKKLRSEMTFSEVKLWNALKNGGMKGYDFDRQRPIGNYIVDFFCKDLMLAIEVDGITHEEEGAMQRDTKRQNELEEIGVQFLRFNALMIVNDVEGATKAIATWIEEYEKGHGVPERVKRKRMG
jgi:very-short-patch-repair endonuclease